VEIYAVDTLGQLLGTYPLDGAANRDWEDIATGPCGAASCIYLADTGDNVEARETLTVYRAQEPADPSSGVPLPTESFPILLPDGPRDIEALFVLPGEELFLVSKGQNHSVTVYRYPPPLRPDPVTLEEVQTLSDGALSIPSQFTGADASPDGRTVVLRTYFSILFYRVENGRLVPMEDGELSLANVGEAQGEGVSLKTGGVVALTSEAGPFGGAQSLNVLRCTGLEG
jgi:hypothetical protein